MQKITPFLWFDSNAEEAMAFYTSAFKNSKVGNVVRYGEAGPGKKGTVMTGSFRLAGRDISALNGGPIFKFTPSISLYVNCETRDEIDTLWTTLSTGGTPLMEIEKYPFSERFGWIQDKFGLSWQLNLTGQKQDVTPFLMYVGNQAGRTEEAIKFYTSIFKNSGIQRIVRNEKGDREPEGTVKHAVFSLGGERLMAMDSHGPHKFTFTEAFSFFVDCGSQEEVDEFWEKLSAGGATSQCGWLKDKFGVSWQIVPSVLGKLLHDPDPSKANRVMHAMLKMTKLDIQTLRRAHDQA